MNPTLTISEDVFTWVVNGSIILLAILTVVILVIFVREAINKSTW